jgi:hypothetical protein
VTVERLAIDPFDEAFLANPYAHHEALRGAGPVVWLEPIGAYGMARYAVGRAKLLPYAASETTAQQYAACDPQFAGRRRTSLKE